MMQSYWRPKSRLAAPLAAVLLLVPAMAKAAEEAGYCYCPGTSGTVKICHIPPGNPEQAHTIHVALAAYQAHLDHGDYLGECLVGGSPKTCTCAGGDSGVWVNVPPAAAKPKSVREIHGK